MASREGRKRAEVLGCAPAEMRRDEARESLRQDRYAEMGGDLAAPSRVNHSRELTDARTRYLGRSPVIDLDSSSSTAACDLT